VSDAVDGIREVALRLDRVEALPERFRDRLVGGSAQREAQRRRFGVCGGDHRSFRKAADALGVTRSALSRTLLGLEEHLGVRVLNRTTRSVSPTEAGARLLGRLEPVLRDLDAALDGLSDHREGPRGTLFRKT
jgi:hypothetical protein